jgi:hypothetical protein
VPLCRPQIPHDLTWDRTRSATVGSRRLTSWAMARPIDVSYGIAICALNTAAPIRLSCPNSRLGFERCRIQIWGKKMTN